MTTAQEIFESLIKDPNHFFLGEEAVKAEALRRVRQHHNNEKALSMAFDSPAVAKLAAFLQKWDESGSSQNADEEAELKFINALRGVVENKLKLNAYNEARLNNLLVSSLPTNVLETVKEVDRDLFTVAMSATNTQPNEDVYKDTLTRNLVEKYGHPAQFYADQEEPYSPTPEQAVPELPQQQQSVPRTLEQELAENEIRDYKIRTVDPLIIEIKQQLNSNMPLTPDQVARLNQVSAWAVQQGDTELKQSVEQYISADTGNPESGGEGAGQGHLQVITSLLDQLSEKVHGGEDSPPDILTPDELEQLEAAKQWLTNSSNALIGSKALSRLEGILQQHTDLESQDDAVEQGYDYENSSTHPSMTPPELSEDGNTLNYWGYDDWKKTSYLGEGNNQLVLWRRVGDDPKTNPNGNVVLQNDRAVFENQAKTNPSIATVLNSKHIRNHEDLGTDSARWAKVTETPQGQPEPSADKPITDPVQIKSLLEELHAHVWASPADGEPFPVRLVPPAVRNLVYTNQNRPEYEGLMGLVNRIDRKSNANAGSNDTDQNLKNTVKALGTHMLSYISSMDPGNQYRGWEIGDTYYDHQAQAQKRTTAHKGWGHPDNIIVEGSRNQIAYERGGERYIRHMADIAKNMESLRKSLMGFMERVNSEEPLTSFDRRLYNIAISPTVVTAGRPDQVPLGGWVISPTNKEGNGFALSSEGQPSLGLNEAAQLLKNSNEFSKLESWEHTGEAAPSQVPPPESEAPKEPVKTDNLITTDAYNQFKTDLTMWVQSMAGRTNINRQGFRDLYTNYYTHADDIAKRTTEEFGEPVDLKSWVSASDGVHLALASLENKNKSKLIRDIISSDLLQKHFAKLTPPPAHMGGAETQTRPVPPDPKNTTDRIRKYPIRATYHQYPVSFPPRQMEKVDGEWKPVAKSNRNLNRESGFEHITKDNLLEPYDPNWEETFAEDLDNPLRESHKQHSVDRKYTLADLNKIHFKWYSQYNIKPWNSRTQEVGKVTPYMWHAPRKDGQGNFVKPYIGKTGLKTLWDAGLITHPNTYSDTPHLITKEPVKLLEADQISKTAHLQNWEWTERGLPLSQIINAMHKFDSNGPETRQLQQINTDEVGNRMYKDGEPEISVDPDTQEPLIESRELRDVVRSEPLQWLVHAWLGGNLNSLAITQDELDAEETTHKANELESARLYNAVNSAGVWIEQPAEMSDEAWALFKRARADGFHPARHWEELPDDKKIPQVGRIMSTTRLRTLESGKVVQDAGYKQLEDNFLPKSLATEDQESQVLYPRNYQMNPQSVPPKLMFADSVFEPFNQKDFTIGETESRGVNTITAKVLNPLRTMYKQLHTMWPGDPPLDANGKVAFADGDAGILQRHRYNEFFQQKAILEEWLKAVAGTYHHGDVNEGLTHPRNHWRSWVFDSEQQAATDYNENMPLGDNQDTWVWHQALTQIGDAKSRVSGSSVLLNGIPNFSMLLESQSNNPFAHFHNGGRGFRLDANENEVGGFLGNLGIEDGNGNLVGIPQQDRVTREWAERLFGEEWTKHHGTALSQYNNLFKDALDDKKVNRYMDLTNWLSSDAPAGSEFGKIHEVFAAGQFMGADDAGTPIVVSEMPDEGLRYNTDNLSTYIDKEASVNAYNQKISEGVPITQDPPEVENFSDEMGDGDGLGDGSDLQTPQLNTGDIIGDAAESVPLGADQSAYEAFFPQTEDEWEDKKTDLIGQLGGEAREWYEWYLDNAVAEKSDEGEIKRHITHHHDGENLEELYKTEEDKVRALADLPLPRDADGVLQPIPINTWNILFGNQTQNIDGFFKKPVLEDLEGDPLADHSERTTLPLPELSEAYKARAAALNERVLNPDNMPLPKGAWEWEDHPDIFRKGKFMGSHADFARSTEQGTWKWNPEGDPTSADHKFAAEKGNTTSEGYHLPPPRIVDRNTKISQILRDYHNGYRMKNEDVHHTKLNQLLDQALTYPGIDDRGNPLDGSDKALLEKNPFYQTWLKEFELVRQGEVKRAGEQARRDDAKPQPTPKPSSDPKPESESTDDPKPDEDAGKSRKELEVEYMGLHHTVTGEWPSSEQMKFVRGQTGYGFGLTDDELIIQIKDLRKKGQDHIHAQVLQKRRKNAMGAIQGLPSLVADEEMGYVPKHQIIDQMMQLINIGHENASILTPAMHKLIELREEEIRKVASAQGFSIDSIVTQAQDEAEQAAKRGAAPWGTDKWYERVQKKTLATNKRQNAYRHTLEDALAMRTDDNYHPHVGVRYNDKTGKFQDFVNTQTFKGLNGHDIKFNEDTYWHYHGVPQEIIRNIKEIDKLEALGPEGRAKLTRAKQIPAGVLAQAELLEPDHYRKEFMVEYLREEVRKAEEEFQSDKTESEVDEEYIEGRRRIKEHEEKSGGTIPTAYREFWDQFNGGHPDHDVEETSRDYNWPLDENGDPEEPPIFHNTPKKPMPMRGIFIPELGAFVNPHRLTNAQQDLIDHKGPGKAGVQYFVRGTGHYGVDEKGNTNPAEPQYALSKLTRRRQAQLAALGYDDQSIMVNHHGETPDKNIPYPYNKLGGMSFGHLGDNHTKYFDAEHDQPQTINSIIEHGVSRHVARDITSEMQRDPMNNAYKVNGESVPMTRWYGQPETTLNKMFLQLETAVNLGRAEGSALHRRGYRYEPKPWLGGPKIPFTQDEERGRRHRLHFIPSPRMIQYFMHPIDWTQRDPTGGPVGREGKRFGFFGGPREGQGGRLTDTERGQDTQYFDYDKRKAVRAHGMVRHGRVALQRWADHQNIVPSKTLMSAMGTLLTGGRWLADKHIYEMEEKAKQEGQAMDAVRRMQRGIRGSDGRYRSDDFVPWGEQRARNEDYLQLKQHIKGLLKFHNTARTESQENLQRSKNDNLPKGSSKLLEQTNYHNDEFIKHKKIDDVLTGIRWDPNQNGVLPTQWPQVNDLYNQYIADGPQKREQIQDYTTALYMPKK